ncbi:MAG TPA: transposase, partial [Acidimicrobiia bacterium]|nr:transposase [Acidimicrobiia bacterium]
PFADACVECPLRPQCTNAKGGRRIRVGSYGHRLADARRQQQDPGWKADYRATRPKVDADFNLLAAAHNLARLAVLGLQFDTATGWAVTN